MKRESPGVVLVIGATLHGTLDQGSYWETFWMAPVRLFFPFLTGLWPRRILPFHCRALGDTMARMHLAVADFPLRRKNDLSLSGWRKLHHVAGLHEVPGLPVPTVAGGAPKENDRKKKQAPAHSHPPTI